MNQLLTFNGLSLIDRMYNIYLKSKFYTIRTLFPNLLNNNSDFNKKGWLNTFNDDFDKISWNNDRNKKWGVGEHWGSFNNNNKSIYFAPPKEIKDSCAVMTIEYKPKSFNNNGERITIPFAASWLSSNKTFRQKHGRFECRMTLPMEKWTWPAFWTWGPSWPPEIDVIEAYGRKDGKDVVNQEINLHWGNRDDGTKSSLRAWKIQVDNWDENLNERFHEFAVEWDEDKIDFFTDGIHVFRFRNKKILDEFFNKGPQWVLVNHNIQGWNIPSSERENYYSEFLVDYVRVYTKISQR